MPFLYVSSRRLGLRVSLFTSIAILASPALLAQNMGAWLPPTGQAVQQVVQGGTLSSVHLPAGHTHGLHQHPYPNSAMAVGIETVRMELPYSINPQATAGGTIPLATPWSTMGQLVAQPTMMAPVEELPIEELPVVIRPVAQTVVPEVIKLLPVGTVNDLQLDDEVYATQFHRVNLSLKGYGQDYKPFTWDDGSPTTPTYVQSQPEDGYGVLASIGVTVGKQGLARGLSVEAEAGYRHAKLKGTQTGKQNIYSGSINLIKEFKPSTRWGFYLGAGAGLARVTYKDIKGTSGTRTLTGLDDRETGLLLNGFTGLSFRLNNNLSLMAEVRHTHLPDLERRSKNRGVLDDALILKEAGLGVRFGF